MSEPLRPLPQGAPEPDAAPHPTRVAVVGTGAVGSTFAFSLLLGGLAAEIVLVDANARKAEGEAMDLMHAVPFARTTRIWAGTIADCAGAAITVISAGAAQKPGETRLDLVRKNAAIFREIVPAVARANPDGIILVATNPVDVLAYLTYRISGLPAGAGHRLRHDPRHGALPGPPRRALRGRPALRPRLHRRRARRHRGAGLVVGEHRRDAARRLRDRQRGRPRPGPAAGDLRGDARRRLPDHRAQGRHLLRRRRRA